MKLSELKTQGDFLAEQLEADPEFRAEWDRTELARALAIAIVEVRAARGLSQRETAELLGMKQPQIARLERGDSNPTLDTLLRVVDGLSIEIAINLRPRHASAKLTPAKRKAGAVVADVATDRSTVVVAA